MGTGSSAEPRSPQDPDAAAGESQPGSPEAETPAAMLAQPEQLEEAAKLLQKNGQISSINGFAEDQVELSLKPEELKGQQAEADITEVGQRETPNVILKEESAENIEIKTPESDKTNADEEPKESPDADKKLPTLEEKTEDQEEPSESPSNDIGFKKAFKFVGFKFSVRKDKTEKSEPVQLLNVKADDTEVAGDGECKEIKVETVQETMRSEVSHPVEKTEQQTQTERVKEETSSEEIKESPVEPGEKGKEAEVKGDGSKLVESPTSPSANETASPLRKFFTQGWAGFRKRTSFRKPKEDDQLVEREKQDQDKETAKENAIKEEPEKEKAVLEKDGPEMSTDETAKKEREESEEITRDASIETHHEKSFTPPSQESAESVNKESEICFAEKICLASKEKSKPIQDSLSSSEQSTLALSEQKHEASLAEEIPKEKLDKYEPISPLVVEKTEEHFEILEDKPEPKAPLATESVDDSAESPEEQKGESSASSPEETIELSPVEKATDVVQVTETEEGATSDMEKKREGVTPWASFKKMVTPKKRVRRLPESDKEEELEKPKSATVSSTAPCEEQEDCKENGDQQKLEKSIDEPKRKVNTSVSWKALICVGSSKKRARKSSSSDEEVGQRLAQERQKTDESGTHKEISQDMTLTSSQESDQGQGNSSPEQAGSPSESEGVSTWKSFKRLVTRRRKTKTKMEDTTEEPVPIPGSEHSASDGDSGKEESWVSFKKLIPGHRKKKSDGIPERAPVEQVGEEATENNEEDYDVPAVVPLSEYEAAEQEKFEAQKAKEDEVNKKKTLVEVGKEVEKEPCPISVEAEALVEKTEGMVERKLFPEIAKAEMSTEKRTIPIEEGEAEVPAEKAGGKVHMEASAEKSDVEVGAPAEKADVKVDVDPPRCPKCWLWGCLFFSFFLILVYGNLILVPL